MDADERKKQIEEWTEEGLWLNHYHFLMQAVVMAMTRCQAWRQFNTKEVLTADQLFEMARLYDEKYPLREGEFFMVTHEGAIGLSPGLEFLTSWLYIPMEPGAERDRLEQQFWENVENAPTEPEQEKEQLQNDVESDNDDDEESVMIVSRPPSLPPVQSMPPSPPPVPPTQPGPPPVPPIPGNDNHQ